ncbi:MAG TPA: flagellar basal body-associated FliL family protein [Bdellovibrionota bacterium]|nr:flagellar basal body-associated FliL family protein [Bdellovibrionota bacterium]
MADEKKKDAAAAPEAAAPAPGGGGGSKLPMLLVLGNCLAAAATLGALVYTRILYKRPAITESAERQRLVKQGTQGAHEVHGGQIEFKAITANIMAMPEKPEGGEGSPAEGKAHYCTLAYSLEVRDMSQADAIERVRAQINVRMLQLLGKKPFDELNSVQGRYLLRSEILEIVNELTGKPLATDVFFTQFIVQ